MSEALNNFLISLASDPDRMTRFIDNPSAELDRDGLTPEEKAVILMRDAHRIRELMGGLRLESNEGTQGGDKGQGRGDHGRNRYKKPSQPSRTRKSTTKKSRRTPKRKK